MYSRVMTSTRPRRVGGDWQLASLWLRCNLLVILLSLFWFPLPLKLSIREWESDELARSLCIYKARYSLAVT